MPGILITECCGQLAQVCMLTDYLEIGGLLLASLFQCNAYAFRTVTWAYLCEIAGREHLGCWSGGSVAPAVRAYVAGSDTHRAWCSMQRKHRGLVRQDMASSCLHVARGHVHLDRHRTARRAYRPDFRQLQLRKYCPTRLAFCSISCVVLCRRETAQDGAIATESKV